MKVIDANLLRSWMDDNSTCTNDSLVSVIITVDLEEAIDSGSLDAPAAAEVPIDQDESLDNIWLVWSNEHMAWWRPSSAGYTSDIEQAGHYRLEEAIRCSNSRSPGRHPSEIPVRLDVALKIRSMSARAAGGGG